MRHQKAGRKFKRSPSHRRMLLRNLATALIEHGRITTTLAKAKELQRFVEPLITLAKGGFNLNNFRRVNAVLTQKKVCFDLFHEIGRAFHIAAPGWRLHRQWLVTADGESQLRQDTDDLGIRHLHAC